LHSAHFPDLTKKWVDFNIHLILAWNIADSGAHSRTMLQAQKLKAFMHVFLVEDDVVLADGILRILHGHGMFVEHAGNGCDAMSILASRETDILVLDIGIPGFDGFEVVRRLRSRGNTIPIMLLTARDAIHDRVRGLELGADDYLVKPFATPELVARIRALARRGASQLPEVRIGSLVLDICSKRAKIDTRALELSTREWAVLEYLVYNASRVVSKQQIIDAIVPWGSELTHNAVEVYVSRIRMKIAAAGVALRTIRGFGYMLEKKSP
jgi:DNA-binding response OmpR family regulator